MITKNVKFGNTEGVTVCEMGTGDVHMCGSTNGKILALKNGEVKKVGGVFDSDDKSFDEMEPPLVFIFNKTESIDSLICMLEHCKENMLSNKDEK